MGYDEAKDEAIAIAREKGMAEQIKYQRAEIARLRALLVAVGVLARDGE